MATKRKRKTTKRKTTNPKHIKKLLKIAKVPEWKFNVIERIKKHKLRFDIDYEKGIYDLTPQEADIYDDSIDDILRIIRKM